MHPRFAQIDGTPTINETGTITPVNQMPLTNTDTVLWPDDYFYNYCINSPRDGMFSNAIDIAESNEEKFIYKIINKGIVEVQKITFDHKIEAIYDNKKT